MIQKFLRKYGWLYIPGVLFLALNSRIQTLAPKALGDAIDMLKASAPREGIYRQSLLIVGIAVAVFITRFAWRMFIIMNARIMEVFLRNELFVKLQKLPVSFYSRWNSGTLMAYAVNDVGAVRMTFGPVIAQSLNGIITGTLSIVAMAQTVSLRLTLFALIPLPLAVYGIIRVGGLVRTKFTRVQALFAKLSGFVNESIMGIRIIKTFAREQEWYLRFLQDSDTMREANVDLVKTSSLISPVTTVTFGLSYAISLIFGGLSVMNGSMQLGDLVAFQGYLALIQGPVVALGRIVNRIQQGTASYKRLKAVYDEPEIPDFDREPDGVPVQGDIVVQDLTFRYPGSDHDKLDHVSFVLPEGQTLGIAGDTGSGKTTLIQLLLKLYPTREGEIRIGDRDLTQIPAVSLREIVGYVPQDGFLFSDSIEQNIRFYKPGASHEDVCRAAKLACIDTEIRSFQNGYDTQVGERGTHLSGGQKQRIALARALLRDPRILILDDTLSAVDHITERRILENLKDVEKQRTSIVISHRLSAICEADQILFFDNGQLAEKGTHAELLQLGGGYAKTWFKQQEDEDEE